MIAPTKITINGKEFNKFSNDTYKVRKVGTNEVYDEAVDLLNANNIYEITDILLPVVEEDNAIMD